MRLAGIVLVFMMASTVHAESPIRRAVPPLPMPRGWKTTTVGNARELKSKLEGASPNTIVLIEDGEYRVGGLIYMRGRKDVLICGKSRDPTKVTIYGRSFEKVDHHDDILRIGNCENITIAYVTFAENHAYGLKVQAESFPKNIHVYGCHFRNNATRGIKGSSSRDGRAAGGSVRWCHFENTKIPPASWQFGGNYITSIDMMALDGWTFADNTFVNIKGRTGGARAAIFFWVRSKNVIIERNIMVGCDRGIAFGNPSGSSARTQDMLHAQHCVARNNIIVPGPDAGIELSWVDDIRVYNNSIWREDVGGRGIRCIKRIGKVEIFNNLVRGRIRLAGSATEKNNVSGSLNGFFANPKVGDLRLVAGAGKAINRGLPVEDLKDDFFGYVRDGRIDIGAAEFGARPVSGRTAAKKSGGKGRNIAAALRPGDPLAGFQSSITSAARLASAGSVEAAAAAYRKIAEKAEGDVKTALKLLAGGTSRAPVVAVVVRGLKTRGTALIYVDFAGRSQRVKLVRADEKQATVSFGGSEMPMAWRVMNPARLGDIARKYAASGADHLAIARYLAAAGYLESARKSVDKAHEAGLSSEASKMAAALKPVLR